MVYTFPRQFATIQFKVLLRRNFHFFLLKPLVSFFSGPLLTYRAFKHSGPRSLRGIANSEFSVAIKDLEESGPRKVCSGRLRFPSNRVTVFAKEDPDNVRWPTDYCNQTEYRSRYNQPKNKSISIAIKRALIEAQFIPQDIFSNI